MLLCSQGWEPQLCVGTTHNSILWILLGTMNWRVVLINGLLGGWHRQMWAGCGVTECIPPGGSEYLNLVVIVQLLSPVQLFVTPWTAACQSSLSFVISQSSLKLMASNHLILSSPSAPAFNFFQHQGLFHWISSSRQVAKCWSCSFSISPSNEYSGLTSFRIDWFDLLVVHQTLKSLLQQHSSKASILWCSAFIPVFLPFRIPWRVKPCGL